METEVPSKCLTCGSNGPNLDNNRGCFETHIPVIEVIHESFRSEKLEGKSSNPDSNSASMSTGNLEEVNSNLEPNSGNAYISDGLLQNGRKKAIQWTKEEHQLFLMGLEIYGKGEWKMIAENCVATRTPTQIAGHAKKYFTRLAASEDQKIRASVFDAPLQQPAVVVDGNGQQNYTVGSFIPAVPYPYGPMTTMLPYHPAYVYQPQAHGPFPGSSSTTIDQTPEAAQICSSSSAKSVDLELRLA